MKEIAGSKSLVLSSEPKDLLRDIFATAYPEQVVATLSPLTLYLGIQAQGVESSLDLLSIVRSNQYKSLLDLHLWTKDEFHEENFWQWLQAIDQETELEHLARFIKIIDVRLLGIIVNRHVEVEYREEPTEAAPGLDFYTPDKGYTWVQLRIEDPERKRVLGRILALIFETDAELFYQLLAESKYVSPVEYEEECFRDKTNRLLDLGLPSVETSSRVHSPLKLGQLKPGESRFELAATKRVSLYPEVQQLEFPQPLANLITDLSAEDASLSESFSLELGQLLNAALIFYWVELHEKDRFSLLKGFVGGCINIGLELACKHFNCGAIQAYQKLKLEQLYRLGLGRFRETERNLQQVEKLRRENPALQASQKYLAVLSGLGSSPPVSVRAESSEIHLQLLEFKPITSLTELEEIDSIIQVELQAISAVG